MALPSTVLAPVTKGEICTTRLTPAQVNLFRYAVVNSYYYQIYIDDLPMWDFVGEASKTTPGELSLYTHKDIEIFYNEDRIIEVSLKSSELVRLFHDYNVGELEVSFTYSVTWTPTTKLFENRFNKYLDSTFFEHKIHWFSITNSFIMVIFLTGMVAVILLRSLRRDYARYDKEDIGMDLDRDIGDDYGWKQVHGDVFRPPPNLAAFSAFVGTGCQLICMTLLVIVYTIVGDLYAERATMLTASIFIYALTSMISGYYAGSFYAQYGGKNWIGTMLFTSMLWPGAVSATALAVNLVAWPYGSSKAIPFMTMDPSSVAIGLIPRPIPDKAWYAEPSVIIALAGLLPFGSIFIEMYYVFSSFFAYKIYYVYSFVLALDFIHRIR
ncbi:hypothetical protein SmJEL517_g05247 [Synchytrium microbalum]|uniref:Transmembrane 9 superfamily member n=1 Tax=Synchytrium microbalum TaxID=1806994 RepID=A0A507BX04_9FUNG|nr:uncharacterized protein SmJEL517_g05247 [Synchytrium microbalum]TPX31399.1 hypothetical protein SmJEL517_g05247 [Synchytrium microbalum]